MNAETVYKYIAKDKAPTDGYQHAAHVMVYAKFQEKLFLGKYDCKYAILVNTSMFPHGVVLVFMQCKSLYVSGSMIASFRSISAVPSPISCVTKIIES